MSDKETVSQLLEKKKAEIAKGLTDVSLDIDGHESTDSGSKEDFRKDGLIDVRTLKIYEQVRNRFNKNPKALTEESVKALADLVYNTSPSGKIGSPISVVETHDGLVLFDGERRTRSSMFNAKRFNDDSYFFQPFRIVDVEYVPGTPEWFLAQAGMNAEGIQEHTDPYTEACMVKESIDAGLTQKRVSELTSFSETKISRLLKIFKLPPDIQEQIKDRTLPYQGQNLKKAIAAHQEHSNSVNATFSSIASEQSRIKKPSVKAPIPESLLNELVQFFYQFRDSVELEGAFPGREGSRKSKVDFLESNVERLSQFVNEKT